MSNNTSLKYLNDYIYGSSGYESGMPDSGGGTTGTTPDSQANMIVTSELISEMGVEKGWTDNDVQNIIRENVTNYRIDKCLNYGELNNMPTLLELTAPYSTDNRLVLKKHVNILSPFKEIPIIFTCENGVILKESIHCIQKEDGMESEAFLPTCDVVAGIPYTDYTSYNPRKENELTFTGDNDGSSEYLSDVEIIYTDSNGETVIGYNDEININETDKIEFKAKSIKQSVNPEQIRFMEIECTNYNSDMIGYRVSYSQNNYDDNPIYIKTRDEAEWVEVGPSTGYNKSSWCFWSPSDSVVTAGKINIFIELMYNHASFSYSSYGAYFKYGGNIRTIRYNDKMLLLSFENWSPGLGEIIVYMSVE